MLRRQHAPDEYSFGTKWLLKRLDSAPKGRFLVETALLVIFRLEE